MNVEISASTLLTPTLVFEGSAPTDLASWSRERLIPGASQWVDKSETQVSLDVSLLFYQYVLMTDYRGAQQKAFRVMPSAFTSPQESSGWSGHITERTEVEDPSATKVSQPTYESAGSSITEEKRAVGIGKYTEALFRSAREERFEDGTRSEFSRELTILVTEYGVAVVEAVTELIMSERVNGEVACEALRSLGEMHHPPSYSHRLKLLERSLRCSSPWVRDGGALGLAWLDDPVAIPHLREAVERENIDELRQDIRQVLTQLEATRSCHWL